MQSLPELLLHKDKVERAILGQIETCEAHVIGTYVQLVNALARYIHTHICNTNMPLTLTYLSFCFICRDLRDSFSSSFQAFFVVLSDRVCQQKASATSQPLDSDQTAKVFECLSFLIK